MDSSTLIVDAKYKRHWEELRQARWSDQENALREEHRQDLLQVLAYANLSASPLTVCCLVYPCAEATWESLRERGRLFHRAEVSVLSRQVQVWLTAVPMSAEVEKVAGPLAEEIRKLTSCSAMAV
jgi:5-methylcytosine-specific restriction endonuclease McrBC regulatory subunit McrC